MSELVRGGQGRSSEEVVDSGYFIAVLLLGLFILFVWAMGLKDAERDERSQEILRSMRDEPAKVQY